LVDSVFSVIASLGISGGKLHEDKFIILKAALEEGGYKVVSAGV
jgi:hypothetical protein